PGSPPVRTGSRSAGRADIRPIPSDRYYRGVKLIEEGDFTKAALFYQEELRDAVRIGTDQWLDSLCYYAMLGEACYQAGELDDALKNFNAALALSLQYPKWLSRVTYASGVSTVAKPASPWGASRRVVPLGVFPPKATIVVGDKITQDRLKKGGAMMEQRAVTIDAAEIIRCTMLATRRRGEILGPLAPFDPKSEEILNLYAKRSVPPNHWSITWLDVLFGIALVQNGRDDDARRVLGEALLMNGQYDHQFTGVALYELGNLYLAAEKPREAAECYYEASISAFHYGDRLLVEESLRRYANARRAAVGGSGDPDPVLRNAYLWAKSHKFALQSTTFGLEVAEDMFAAGQTKAAVSALGALNATMKATGGRGLRTSRAADRWNYLQALLHYSSGDVAAGDASLKAVVEGERLRSTWALQLRRLDRYVAGGLSSNGPITPRNAADLYAALLREPTAVDWGFRPTESIAIRSIAPPEAYERWFRLLFERDLKDKAFEVAERIRRERFYSTQKYGGRLVSLRYLLTADDALLTTANQTARQAILLRYPALEASLKASKETAAALDALPTVPRDADGRDRQTQLFARLDKLATEQEAAFRCVVAGRDYVPNVFPPSLSAADVQKRLPDETAILSFLDAEGETFGFMIGKNCLDSWRVGPTDRVGAAVSTFLRSLGCVEGTRQVASVDLKEARWKSQGAKLREIVLGASDVEAERFNVVFSKLVVVPDSVLWYLPFEALCLPAVAATLDEETETAQADGDENADGETPETIAQNAENAAQTAEPDDLDAAYSVADDAPEAPADADEAEPQEPAKTASKSQKSTATKASDAETTAESKPRRRSRSAREREELDAYEATLVPMISAQDLTIRYSATVALALPNAFGRNAFVDTTVLLGETFPKETKETTDAAFDRLSQAVSKTEGLRRGALKAVPGSLYATRLRRLVVFDEIVADGWNWAPGVPSDARRGHGVADWIFAPWGAPRLLVLPALRTPAENSLKNGGDGSEFFLPILAAQSTGADAMLLSRWRTGGRSAFDLSTDFLKNYESQPVAEAWKNAVLALMKRDVVLDEEPRLKTPGRSEEPPRYDQPFWWAGYLLIDSGEALSADELKKLQAEADAAKKPNADAN
ncbi:MAG: tetratricopeptide repeat protein, partial [Thermoguttaceae bacterium]|nr:tetratricopeptide repeat protein [Thermoguttaceae bacterium]